MPDQERLFLSEECNPHGAGVAWFERSHGKVVGVRWKKGLDVKEVIHILSMKSVLLPVMIHFRWASVGPQAKELCHPFPITPSAELTLEGMNTSGVLMHNGHWGSGWKEALWWTTITANRRIPTGMMSDSRVMAILAANHGYDMMKFMPSGSGRISILHPTMGLNIYGDGWTHEKTEGYHQSSQVFAGKRKGTGCDLTSMRDSFRGMTDEMKEFWESRMGGEA